LRRHFEVNAESIATAALSRLARDGRFDMEKAKAAFGELGVDTEKIDPSRRKAAMLHYPERYRSRGQRERLLRGCPLLRNEA